MVVEQREPMLSQLRRGVLEYCVMAALREGERYGYELVAELAAANGLLTSEGTIYPLLGRLRKDGSVATTWRESASGPPRRYYSLTASGHATLDRFRGEWTRFRAAVDAILDTEEETCRPRLRNVSSRAT
jgi:PadR family transcriptional regulator, regulatory protein PadR